MPRVRENEVPPVHYLTALGMKKRSHSLVSFSTYLNKGFALRQHARQMADARQGPEISPASVS